MSRCEYMYNILQLERDMNEETTEIRQAILDFVARNKCIEACSESANGTHINLDKMPENTLRDMYAAIYKLLDMRPL